MKDLLIDDNDRGNGDGWTKILYHDSCTSQHQE